MSIVPTRSPWCAFVVVAVALSARAPVARAQDEQGDAAASVAELNRKALDDYDNLNFEEAKNRLKSALALCDKSGLGGNPVRAQSYLNLGVVLLAADAQHRDVAVAQFRRAIQIQPDIQLPERIANPEVQQAFAEAKAAAHGPVPAAPRPAVVAAGPGSGAAPRSPPRPPARPRESEDDGEVEASAEAASDGERPLWFVGMGIGSGVGWASGSGEVNSDVHLPSGFEPSSLIHLTPELGYFLRRDLLLSVQGRIQFISSATAERSPNGTACGSDRICSPSHGATAVFAKATWFLSPSGFRPYLSGALGYGQIRHVVTLPGHVDCGTDPAHPVTCVDTAAAGPILLGPGAGFMVEVSRHIALTLGVNTVVGISAFTFHVDVGGGIAVEL